MSIQNNTSESWRSRYIRLLTAPNPEWTAEKEDFSESQILDLEAIADLIDEGYMRGEAVRDEVCDVVTTSTYGVTLSGKLFAEKQQEILRKNSFWGRVLSGAGLFIGWLSGIISAVIIWYLTK